MINTSQSCCFERHIQWVLLHALSAISDVQSEALELPWQTVLARLGCWCLNEACWFRMFAGSSDDFCCMYYLISVMCKSEALELPWQDRPRTLALLVLEWSMLVPNCLLGPSDDFLLHVLSDISDVQSEALELPWQDRPSMLALLVLEWSMFVPNCLLGPVMISVACIIWHQWCAIRSSRITLTGPC